MKLLFSLTLLLSVVSNLWGEIYSEKQSPKLELVPENFLKNLRILILFFFSYWRNLVTILVYLPHFLRNPCE